MKTTNTKKLPILLILFPIVVFLLNGCTAPVEDGLPGDESDPSSYHSTGWRDDPQHGSDFSANPQNCKACHGQYVNGGPANVSCFSQCHRDYDKCDCCHDNNGTSASHTTHNTETNNNRGPAQLACQACHDSPDHPNFADGRNSPNTTVCNTCHSPGGFYDGINDPNIGSKNNWADGAYDGNVLKSGKERWCVGCHDNDPAFIDGVDAPKIGGDGANYGYFVNGHGNAPNDTELACADCHDLSLTHIDEEPRTYEFDPANYNDGGSSYQTGYRLKSVGGQPPMNVPANTIPDTVNDYRLCFDSGCHLWDDIFGDTPVVTNFNASGDDPPLSYSYGTPPLWRRTNIIYM